MINQFTFVESPTTFTMFYILGLRIYYMNSRVIGYRCANSPGGTR